MCMVRFLLHAMAGPRHPEPHRAPSPGCSHGAPRTLPRLLPSPPSRRSDRTFIFQLGNGVSSPSGNLKNDCSGAQWLFFFCFPGNLRYLQLLSPTIRFYPNHWAQVSFLQPLRFLRCLRPPHRPSLLNNPLYLGLYPLFIAHHRAALYPAAVCLPCLCSWSDTIQLLQQIAKTPVFFWQWMSGYFLCVSWRSDSNLGYHSLRHDV